LLVLKVGQIRELGKVAFVLYISKLSRELVVASSSFETIS